MNPSWFKIPDDDFRLIRGEKLFGVSQLDKRCL